MSLKPESSANVTRIGITSTGDVNRVDNNQNVHIETTTALISTIVPSVNAEEYTAINSLTFSQNANVANLEFQETPTIKKAIQTGTGEPSGSYVRYDTDSQGLTDTEKSNARTNIGAGTSNFSGDYDDLINKPSIPSVNNATLTIQKNGTTVNTFTANASSSVTANIAVPTNTSELTNNSGFITINDVPQEIFWCIYGRTDYSEINTALNEGKLPCVKRNDRIYIYTSSSSSPDKEHHFWSVEGSNIYSLDVRSMNSWSEGYSLLESRLNKVVSISSSSKDTQYPSAKCVYDNIQDVREVAEGKKQTYVVSDVTNPNFNNQNDDITILSFTDINGDTFDATNTSIGDTIYIKEIDVPDRWISLKLANIIQRAENGNFADDTYWPFGSISNNILTWSPRFQYDANSYSKKVTFIQNHKYLIMITHKSTGGSNIQVSISSATYGTFGKSVACQSSDNWITSYAISTISTTKNETMQFMNLQYSEGYTIYFKDFMIVDLTETFGSGNEPTTLEEFKAYYPNDYYSYNETQGTQSLILSKLETAKVPIESISVNGTNIPPVLSNVDITVPIKTSDLTNDSDFATHTDLDNYVDLSNEQTIAGLKTFTQRPLSNTVYTQLEYIESPATPTVFPYIKTGVRRGTTYSDTESLSCVFDGYFTASQALGFFGYDGGGQLGQRNGYWSTEGGNSNVSALTRATVLQVINFSGNYDRLYIGGSQIATRTISTAASHSINGDYPLFVAYNGNYTYRPAKARLYSFKMYIGDYYTSPSSCTLIRDFIPAKSPTGEIGLLDLVENKFYANSGTENFIAGPNVTTVTTTSPLLITTDVSKVGFSNNYNDLDNKPSIPSVSNVTITLQQNGTTIDSFTLNQGNSKTINFTIPTKTSELTNDSGFITTNAIPIKTISVNNTQIQPVSNNVNIDLYSYHDDTKQDTLVSGTNIKTINGQSILGEGDIVIQGENGGSSSSTGDATIITYLRWRSTDGMNWLNIPIPKYAEANLFATVNTLLTQQGITANISSLQDIVNLYDTMREDSTYKYSVFSIVFLVILFGTGATQTLSFYREIDGYARPCTFTTTQMPSPNDQFTQTFTFTIDGESSTTTWDITQDSKHELSILKTITVPVGSSSSIVSGGSGKFYQYDFNLYVYDGEDANPEANSFSALIYESNFERIKAHASEFNLTINTPQDIVTIINSLSETSPGTDDSAFKIITFLITVADHFLWFKSGTPLRAIIDVAGFGIQAVGQTTGLFVGIHLGEENNTTITYYGLNTDNSCTLTEYGTSASGGTVEVEPIISIKMTNLDCRQYDSEPETHKYIFQAYGTKASWNKLVLQVKSGFSFDLTYENFGTFIKNLPMSSQAGLIAGLLSDYINGNILPIAYLQDEYNGYCYFLSNVVFNDEMTYYEASWSGQTFPSSDRSNEIPYFSSSSVITIEEIDGPAIGSGSSASDDRLPTPTSSDAGKEIYATNDGKYAFADVMHFVVADFVGIDVYFLNTPSFESQSVTTMNTMIDSTNSQYGTSIPNISGFNEIYGLFKYFKDNRLDTIFKSFYASLLMSLYALKVKIQYSVLFEVDAHLKFINGRIVSNMLVADDVIMWYQDYDTQTEQLSLIKYIPLTTDYLADVDYNGIRTPLS